MSVSDRLTDVYHSTDSSTKAFSLSIPDGHDIKGQEHSKALAASVDASPHVTTAAVTTHGDLTLGATESDSTRQPVARRLASVEHEAFEAALATNDGDSALLQPVIKRRDISLADISRMRLEGCRARRTSLAATTSLRGSMASSLRSTSASPMLSLTARLRDQAGIFGEMNVGPTPAAQHAPAWSSLIGLGRSIHRRSSMSSARTNALETSFAILQHMAQDTAARLEAACTARSLAGTPSTATSACGSVALTSLQPAHQNPVHTNASAIGREAECVNPDSGRDSCSHSGQHTPLLQAVPTQQFNSTSPFSSSLNSLSESELRVGQLRAGGLPRLRARALAAHAASAAAVAKAVSASRQSSPLPCLDGTQLAARQLSNAPAHHLTKQRPGANTTLLELLPTPVATTTEAARPASLCHARDVSACNHDFQQIIPLEVKEALQRNMRPICEGDDEENAALDDGLKVQLPPPLTCFAKVAQATSEDRRGSDSPPSGAYPRGVTGSGGSGGAGAGATPGDAPFSSPMSSLRPQSVLSTSPNVLARSAAASSMGAWHADSACGGKSMQRLGSGTAETMAAGLSISGTGVPFQTWKFPSLGKPNSALSFRRMSLGEDGNAEEALPGGAKGGARPAPPTASPISDHGSHATRGALTLGSRPQQGSEGPPFADNRLLVAHKRTTLKPTTTLPSSVTVSALSVTGNADPCVTSLLSGESHACQTASCAHARSAQFSGGAGGCVPQLPPAAERSFCTANSFSDAADGDKSRKVKMLCAVYERLRCARPPASGFAAGAPKSLQAWSLPTRAGAALSPGPASSLAQATPHTSLLGTATPLGKGAGFEATNQGGFTASMSYSGALGRSAGYYSFGKRISLSHPNRQTLPHQFLGSASNLHAMPSPRKTLLDSSALTESVAVLNGDVSDSTIPSSYTARPQRRSLDLWLLRRIESRPLLQTTMFLQSNLRSICETLTRRTRAEREEDPGLALQYTAICPSAPTAASASVTASVAPVEVEYLCRYTFPTELQSAAGAPSAASVADIEAREDASGASQIPINGPAALAEAASPTSSVYAATSKEPNISGSGSNNGTHDSAVGTALEPPLLFSAGKLTNASNLFMNSIEDVQEKKESQPRKQAEAYMDHTADEPVAAAMERFAAANSDSPTAANVPVAPESYGSPPHPYRRVLTKDARLVRHVHGVDGVEREVDNDAMDLVVYVGMHLMGWLEVVGLLGCGSFGQVFLCKDLRICDGHFVHPSETEGDDYEYWNCSHAFLPFSSVDAVPTHQPLVAVKVVKSVPLLEQQSVLEAEMLVLIGAQTAPLTARAAEESGESITPAGAATTAHHTGASAPPPEDPRCANIAKVLADGICYGHHCIVMERYGANLYEYIAANDHRGLPMHQIRSIGAQLFSALTLVHEECHIIHADVKPENVLLTLDFCKGTLRGKDEPVPVIHDAAASTTLEGTAHEGNSGATSVAVKTPRSLPELKASSRAAHGSAHPESPSTEPPWHQLRTESTALLTSSSTLPAERTSTLQVGPGAVVRQRPGLHGKHRASNPLQEASTLASSSTRAFVAYKRHSFDHYRPSPASHASMVEQTDLPAPEPRRSQMLNQSLCMLSSTANGMTLPSPSRGDADSGDDLTMQVDTTPVEKALPVPYAPAISNLRVRLIDFSSSCYEGGPFYQYIQSRYYRAPEVIVGVPYSSGIDVWSTGCMLAELLLGMPLLPGGNDHHQLSLIEGMLGPLPDYMIENGDNAELFYTAAATVAEDSTDAGRPRLSPAATTDAASSAAPQRPRRFALRSREDYLEITGGEPVPYRRYFTYQTLQELVRHCPLTLEERRMSYGLQPYVVANESASIPPDVTPSQSVRSDMMKQRFLLFDLLRRLLQMDPKLRPTAAEALTHPFFTSSPPYLKTFSLK
ncbi:hypothetical protein LSCM1_06225 [Leishmania martiniquensis]|uniref:Protein kinase domain-containing protein n=1 Tax=Leishmania martiniquensis TaxID=1580590 RepID=A0A836GEH6_9TRYP|nr:hypothetical protein LSCM1_06225 [Leishmania martiniquensis]